MKYKLIGLLQVALTLLAIFIISISMPADNGKRYIEHIDAEPKAECIEHNDGGLCTHLPIVMIETGGVTIPGRPIYNDNHAITGYTLTDSGEELLLAKITVIDNYGVNNHTGDSPSIRSDILVRIRGNSSRTFDKPNYLVKLVKPDLTNNPQEFLGMDSHHEWNLHGPYLDKSLIRNYMWYNIAGEMMEYAPNVRFCEVIVNGSYQGLYLATETITAGENGARLGVSVNKKDNDFSGYIIRLDKGEKGDAQNFVPFTKYARRTQMQHEVIYPGRKNITPELKEAIKDDFSFFEKTLYSYDFDNKDYGYSKHIDVDSFVDYFLINEITANYDAGWMSTYMYKDIDGKYNMCVWDFNSACDFYQDSVMPFDRMEMHHCLWFYMLIKDEGFVERIIERYWEIRNTVFSDEYIDKFINDTVRYLGDSVERNYSVWGYSFSDEHDMLHPTERNPRSHEESIEQMHTFLDKRLAWMDENIESLRQYSSTSKNKKFDEDAN